MAGDLKFSFVVLQIETSPEFYLQALEPRQVIVKVMLLEAVTHPTLDPMWRRWEHFLKEPFRSLNPFFILKIHMIELPENGEKKTKLGIL